MRLPNLLSLSRMSSPARGVAARERRHAPPGAVSIPSDPPSRIEADARRRRHSDLPRGPTSSARRRLTPSPAALVLWILAGSVLLRLALMVTIGFGNDEAYTIVGARSLHLSYFDHPPLHVWLAHISALAFGETRWLRLPFVLLFAGTGWLMFTLTRRLYGAPAGVWAVLALSLTPFFTLSPGGWVVPDGPLLFFLLAAALALVPAVLQVPEETPHPWRAWSVGGLCFGLAGLSKYSALPIALGLVAFMVASPRGRRWLTHPAPYGGAAVAGLAILPVMVWNAENGWVSLAFQTGRGLPQAALHPSAPLSMALGEVALLSPWVAVPLIAATAQRLIAKGERRPGDALLSTLALPTILAFTAVPLWSARGLPHWPMPAWMFLYPLLGSWIVDRRHRPGLVRRWVAGSALAFALLLGIGVTAARDGWASRAFALAEADPTLEALDWTALRTAPAVTKAHPAFVVALRWMDAGKLGLALGPALPTYVFSDDPRQFAFAPAVSRHLGQDAVIVMPARLAATRLPALRLYFESLGPVDHVRLGRGGRPEVDLAVIHAHALSVPFPLPYPRQTSPETRP